MVLVSLNAYVQATYNLSWGYSRAKISGISKWGLSLHCRCEGLTARLEMRYWNSWKYVLPSKLESWYSVQNFQMQLDHNHHILQYAYLRAQNMHAAWNAMNYSFHGLIFVWIYTFVGQEQSSTLTAGHSYLKNLRGCSCLKRQVPVNNIRILHLKI